MSLVSFSSCRLAAAVQLLSLRAAQLRSRLRHERLGKDLLKVVSLVEIFLLVLVGLTQFSGLHEVEDDLAEVGGASDAPGMEQIGRASCRERARPPRGGV